MAKEKYDYFNFPVVLLCDAFYYIEDFCYNAICYAVYEQSLKLEFGDELERMAASAKKFDAPFTNIEKSYNNGMHLYNTIKQKTPITGISRKMLFDFYKKEKTEFEITSLVAFLGLKSIIGTKTYCKSTMDLLLNRMAGYSSCKNDLPPHILKYKKEYYWKKLILELESNWHLKYYSRYMRGYSFSFDLPLEEVVMLSELDKANNKKKKFKETKAEIIKNTLKKI